MSLREDAAASESHSSARIGLKLVRKSIRRLANEEEYCRARDGRLLSSMSMPAFAIKPLNDKFTEIYGAADDKDVPTATKDAFKEAKCNICHAGADKKKRNPFGQAVGKQLKETKFDLADFKKNPNNYTTS